MSEYSRPPSFDFGAATLQGFNLPGGKRYLFRVALWTAALLTLAYVILGTPIVKAYVDVFKNAIEMEHSLDGTTDPDAFLAVMAPMFRAMGMVMLIGLLQVAIFAAAETAIYRNILHGEDRGVFPLTFGTDEFRVLGTRLVVGLMLGCAYVGAYLIAFIIGAILVGLAGATGSSVLAAISGILIFGLIIVAIAAFVWVAIRLAPSAAFSVKYRAFNPFASWAPMKGLVWPAIGSFLILYLVGYFILNFVITIIFIVLFFASGIMGVIMEIDASANELPDMSPLWEHLSSPGFMIPLILGVFVSIFLWMIWYGTLWSLWGYLAKQEQGALQPPVTQVEGEIW